MPDRRQCPLDTNATNMRQSRARQLVTSRTMRQVLDNLILSERTFHHWARGQFRHFHFYLWTTRKWENQHCASIGNLIESQPLYIPYALFVDGQVIKLYDLVNQKLAGDEMIPPAPVLCAPAQKRDPRWMKIARPFVVVGGELTLAGLDLVYDDVHRFYEAPFQLKANGGILLIDDFGRQQVRPRDLLNRWIVPLENRIDYLTLHTGRKVEITFDVLVIFSTNLPPKDLVDEAFLRRLRHKIEIGDPTFEEYREIFKRVAQKKGVITANRAWLTCCRNGMSSAIASCAPLIRATCATRFWISPATRRSSQR